MHYKISIFLSHTHTLSLSGLPQKRTVNQYPSLGAYLIGTGRGIS